MEKIKAYMNWSGGKDSSLCLYKVLQENKYRVDYLLTSINKTYNRVSMHGVRRELLELQAVSLGIPLKLIELPEQPGMAEYENEMEKKVKEITGEGILHTFFGDIFLQDLRKYREDKLRPLRVQAQFPLWNIPTSELMEDFLRLGFKAIIVCVNEKYLDKSFCGRMIDRSFVNDLPGNVDPCGEKGEYHSFVFDGPILNKPVPFLKGEIIYREYAKPKEAVGSPCRPEINEEKTYGFYFCDLIPLV